MKMTAIAHYYSICLGHSSAKPRGEPYTVRHHAQIHPVQLARGRVPRRSSRPGPIAAPRFGPGTQASAAAQADAERPSDPVARALRIAGDFAGRTVGRLHRAQDELGRQRVRHADLAGRYPKRRDAPVDQRKEVEHGAAWSPDGSRLAFGSDRTD